ncbi:MAG TPA: hypothetical protein DD624_04325 [Alphaproteobacteria bacterium]|nr:hypothetical protein [Alphaproteobacteria bacterium]
MKNKVLTVAAVSLLTACAGFKPDYEVKDASEASKPAWTIQSKTAKIDSSSERKTNRYYVSDGMGATQRLCLRDAEANAKRKLASEIAQEIAGTFEEVSKSQDDAASTKMKDKLAQNIQVNMHGVVVAEKYWEKRSYLKTLGAEKDYVAYKCDVAVKIKKDALVDAIEMYKAKTLRTLKGDEKEAMEKAVNKTVEALKAETNE